MGSELRLRPCARPACDARRNQSRTGSCCDGIYVSFLCPRPATDSTQRNVSQLSRKSRASTRKFPMIPLMRHDPLPAQGYNIPWPNGKPLLSERSVFARRCLRLDCLRAVSYRLLSCPRRMTKLWPARGNAAPLRASKAQRSLRRRPPLATNDRAPVLHPARKHAAPLHPR